jgi:predicted aspartyl protease
MIVGSVGPDGVPTIPVAVAGQTFQATIDTGFNGDLELPDSLRGPLNPTWRGRIRSLLAGGQVVDEDYYGVQFSFDGQTVLAEVSFTPGGPILIGTRFLQKYRLEINFATRAVLLERVVLP